jgi:putative ABC transport system permease protein
MFKVTLQSLAAKKLRLVLTSIAVVLGVAFMAGTFVLTDTLGSVFDNLFADTTKGVDAVVRAREAFEAADEQGNNTETRPPVPASLVREVRKVPQVAQAQGSLIGYALVIGKDGDAVQNQAPTLASPWRPPSVSVNRSLDIQAGHGPRAPDEVMLDKKTFDDGGFRIGQASITCPPAASDPTAGPKSCVKINFLSVEPRFFKITGTFISGGSEDGLAGATLTAFTPPVAQEVTGNTGRWSQIEVRGTADLSEVEVRDGIRTALADAGQTKQFEAITGDKLAEEQADSIKDNLSFFNTFLLIFALIALFVGAFIIYNTFSITVAQRTRELGLLRALGASGRQVVGSVALEALVVGIVASVLGILLGLAIVKPLEALLSAFGIDLPGGPLQVLPRTVIVSLIVGIGVTFVSALAPARRAARVAPIAALRDQALPPTSGRRRYLWGGLLAVVGLVALFYGLFGGSGSAAEMVGIAGALVFIGVAMLSPLIARPVTRFLTLPAEWTNRITGLLAQKNAMRNPRRTSSTAAALMIGLALVSLIAIFGASAKDSFAAAIEDQTRADFVLSPEGFQPFSPEAARAVRTGFQQEFGKPGTQIQFRSGSVKFGDEAVAVTGVPGNVERGVDIRLRPGAQTRAFDRDGGVFIYKDVASDKHLKVGDTVDTVFPKATIPLTVQGIFTDQRVISQDYLVSLTDWKYFDEATDFTVIILKPPGVTTAEAQKVVDQVAKDFPSIKAQNKAQFKDSQLAQFDQILGLMYVLLLLAVVIALIGILNTLALSVYERTREIGLLRAVGMTRKQTSRMVRGEALIVAVFGSLLGLAIGVIFGAAIVQALDSEGISLTLPVTQLVVFLVLAGLFGVLAGWVPARRAAHLDVLRAINTE